MLIELIMLMKEIYRKITKVTNVATHYRALLNFCSVNTIGNNLRDTPDMSKPLTF